MIRPVLYFRKNFFRIYPKSNQGSCRPKPIRVSYVVVVIEIPTISVENTSIATIEVIRGQRYTKPYKKRKSFIAKLIV